MRCAGCGFGDCVGEMGNTGDVELYNEITVFIYVTFFY